MEKNKILVYSLGAVVAVALIGWGIAYSVRRHELSLVGQNSNQPATLESQGLYASSSPEASSSPADQKSLTYTKALSLYPYRIQFSNCRGFVGTPGNGTLAIKRGVKFMLDNRDNQSHRIAFVGHSIHLEPYGFAIVSATSTGTYPLTCDGGGSATLKVE